AILQLVTQLSRIVAAADQREHRPVDTLGAYLALQARQTALEVATVRTVFDHFLLDVSAAVDRVHVAECTRHVFAAHALGRILDALRAPALGGASRIALRVYVTNHAARIDRVDVAIVAERVAIVAAALALAVAAAVGAHLLDVLEIAAGVDAEQQIVQALQAIAGCTGRIDAGSVDAARLAHLDQIAEPATAVEPVAGAALTDGSAAAGALDALSLLTLLFTDLDHGPRVVAGIDPRDVTLHTQSDWLVVAGVRHVVGVRTRVGVRIGRDRIGVVRSRAVRGGVSAGIDARLDQRRGAPVVVTACGERR